MQIDLGGFQFREDLHIFSYQDKPEGCFMAAFTKKEEISKRSFVVLIKLSSLRDIAREVELAIVPVPEETEITDMFFTPSNRLAVCKRPSGSRIE